MLVVMKNLSSLLSVVVFTFLSWTAFGAVDTWSGGGNPDFDWSNAGNWGGIIPAPGDTLVFSGGTGLTVTNDLTVDTAYNGFSFAAGAGPFTLYGNSLTLGPSGITNSSSSVQTIRLGINFNASRILDGGAGGLIIGGGLTNTSGSPGITTITLAGTGTLSNQFNSTTVNPGGTNVFLTSSTANWTLVDNPSSIPISVPWSFVVHNGGTFTFGAANSAPVLSAVAADSQSTNRFQIGNNTGTSTFNMVNGTLNLSMRINVGTGTGGAVMNMSGGTINIGTNGLSIADGSVFTIGNLNISGGTLNINSGTFFIATRGKGTNNINGGTINAGVLDITRNITNSVGVLNLNGGLLRVTSVTNGSQNSAAILNAGASGTMYFNGGTLEFKASGVFQGHNGTPYLLPITANVKAGGAIVTNDTGIVATFNDPLLHDPALGASADGGLVKKGAGTMILTGTNTYTGNTVINAGTLALTNNGSISNSPIIIVAGGAMFDVSAHNGTFGLPISQTLSNSSSPALLGGNIDVSTGTNSLTFASGTPAFIFTNGTLTLASGSTFKVNNTGPALAAGIYKLIAAGTTTGGTGTLGGTEPSSVIVTGGGIVGGNIASLQIDSGELDLVVSTATPPTPRLTGVSVSGPTLTLTATNGALFGRYYLLSSTNVALPFSQWITNVVGNFSGTGQLNLSTNIVNASAPQTFYLLKQ
jgi:autotransporter-associated beta strand protein